MAGGTTQQSYTGAAYNTALIFAYLGLNSLLNLTNKWALGVYGLSFPLLLTTTHMAFSFTVLLPFMLRPSMRQRHKETLSKQWKGIAAIGLYMATNVALNNSSLVFVTLTLNQIIRSSIPVFTALMALVIEKYRPSPGETTGLFLLTGGVITAVWSGSVAGRPMGIVLCLMGTVCNAAMMSTSGRVLSEKLDALRLTFYTAPISCAVLLPAFLRYEYPRFMIYLTEHGWETGGILLASSIVALSYNVIHYLMIQQTSAVTTTVIGEAKIIGLLILSAFLLGESRAFTIRLFLGCLMALTGFAFYSYSKVSQQQVKTAATLKSAKSSPAKGPNDFDPEAQSSEKVPLLRPTAGAK